MSLTCNQIEDRCNSLEILLVEASAEINRLSGEIVAIIGPMPVSDYFRIFQDSHYELQDRISVEVDCADPEV